MPVVMVIVKGRTDDETAIVFVPSNVAIDEAIDVVPNFEASRASLHVTGAVLMIWDEIAATHIEMMKPYVLNKYPDVRAE